MPKKFSDAAETIYNMKVRPDDIWVITYPKSGTTWMLELVWQVANGVNLGKDLPDRHERTPFLEISTLEPGPLIGRDQELPEELVKICASQNADPRLAANSIAWVEDMKSPRIVKTHLPLEFLPPNLLDTAKGRLVLFDYEYDTKKKPNYQEFLAPATLVTTA